jgi:PKD domain
MKSRTCWVVSMLAIATGALAQTTTPTQLNGVINDYSPSTTVTPMGPWEMRGPWTLTLNPNATQGDFSATLTMELSDYTRNSSNIDVTSGTGSRMQHTHHIAIKAGTVTPIPTGGFELSGPVTITKDGSPAPLMPSTLSVDITGGTSVQFSNIALQFGGGAIVHFGSQLIHGVVTIPPANPITILIIGPGGVTSANNTFKISSSQITLDASQSTSTNAGPLSYSWQPAPGYPSPGISGGNTATPFFQLGQPGTYEVTLTVTDSTGAMANATVILGYNNNSCTSCLCTNCWLY